VAAGLIHTVGHSTQERADLVALLRAHGVQQVADVRRYPASRRHPQFNADTLANTLPAEGVAYEHLEALGGRRSRRRDSPNDGWKDAGFQGYADWMAEPAFQQALARLEALAQERSTAVMCAEGMWWHCHRRLVADALLVRGWTVAHILPDGRAIEHELTEFAVVRDEGALIYPAPQGRLV
jgi:uncharacterized protein (DUF488 family)